MDVSIVIISFNTSKLLDECIDSIKEETRCTYEIIVVDNASSDDSCRIMKAKHPEVKLIENSDNVGFARANNQGFAVAKGRYFFMLNSDTLILDGAVDKLMQFMEHNPDVGICGPRNVGRDGELQYSCDHFPNIWNTFCMYANLMNRYPNFKIVRRSQMRYWDYAETRCVEKVMGCSLFIRAELFRQLGGLDNHYFMYFEETDLGYRAIQSGSKIVYVPSASIVHYGGESSRTQTRQPVINKVVYAYYLSSQYYFYRKNYGLLPMLSMRCLDLGYGLFLLLKNLIRRDKAIREHRITKAHALCAGAVAGWVAPDGKS